MSEMNEPRIGFSPLHSWQYRQKEILILSLKAPGWKGFWRPSAKQLAIHLILWGLQRQLLESSMTVYSFSDPCFTSLWLIQITMWQHRVFQNDTVSGSICTFSFTFFYKKTTKGNKNVLFFFKLRMDVLLWIMRSFYFLWFIQSVTLYWRNSTSGLGRWSFPLWLAVFRCPLWLLCYLYNITPKSTSCGRNFLGF